MASIVPYKGSWKCQVRKKGYPSQTRTFPTKKEAAAWGISIEAQINSGTFLVQDDATKNMTVADLLDRYVNEESPNKRSGEDDVYRIEPTKRALGQYGVTKLTNTILSEHKRKRLAVRSPQTVAHELNLLHRAYVIGVQEWGLVLPMGIPRTSRPRLPQGRERRVSQNEIDMILNETRSEQLRSILMLAVETAMRRGELLSMKWNQVDFDRRTVFLPRTKTDSPRTVPLSKLALATLESIKKDSGPVFTLSGRDTTQAFKRAADRLGLEDLRFHDLRHEATSRLFEKGLNVMEVASITGHKSMQMLSRYTHLDSRNLVDKLG